MNEIYIKIYKVLVLFLSDFSSSFKFIWYLFLLLVGIEQLKWKWMKYRPNLSSLIQSRQQVTFMETSFMLLQQLMISKEGKMKPDGDRWSPISLRYWFLVPVFSGMIWQVSFGSKVQNFISKYKWFGTIYSHMGIQ